jgi:hypothetical protein
MKASEIVLSVSCGVTASCRNGGEESPASAFHRFNPLANTLHRISARKIVTSVRHGSRIHRVSQQILEGPCHRELRGSRSTPRGSKDNDNPGLKRTASITTARSVVVGNSETCTSTIQSYNLRVDDELGSATAPAGKPAIVEPT